MWDALSPSPLSPPHWVCFITSFDSSPFSPCQYFLTASPAIPLLACVLSARGLFFLTACHLHEHTSWNDIHDLPFLSRTSIHRQITQHSVLPVNKMADDGCVAELMEWEGRAGPVLAAVLHCGSRTLPSPVLLFLCAIPLSQAPSNLSRFKSLW